MSASKRDSIDLECPITLFFDEKLQNAEKILLIDRDGTINKDPGYSHKFYENSLIEGVSNFLKKAIADLWTPVVVSNQSGIQKGIFTIHDAIKFNSQLRDFLLLENIPINYFIFCPHDSIYGCANRKPNIGMIEYVMKCAPLANYHFIGNMSTDLEAAKNANIKYSDINSILTSTGDYFFS